MKTLFYISGHGFGHATRIAAIMKALIDRDASAQLYVKTRAGRLLFEGVPNSCLHYYDKMIDAGVIERDIFSQDVPATLSRCIEINSSKGDIVREEAGFAKTEDIDVIVSDIPPLASDIGQSADIPTVAVGNFSWDFIYDPYVHLYPEFAGLVDEMRISYGKTNLLLRLPFHHEMEAFPRQRDIPLVVRRRTVESEETKVRLGIPLGRSRPVVFLALRMSDASVRKGLDDLVRSDQFLLLSTERLSGADEGKVRIVPPEMRITEFPNIMGASDVVISKLGYGMASECVAARTALMYPPREDFAEHAVLESSIEQTLPSYCMPKKDFLDGKWSSHVKKFLRRGFTWTDTRTDGAEVAAEIIMSHKKPFQ